LKIKKNGLKAELVFNPDKKTGIVNYLSSFVVPRSSSPTCVDHVRGEIIQKQRIVSKVEGSWIDCLTFDGQVYWTKRQFKPFKTMNAPANEALPSDCQFREDLLHLARNDVESSQQWKNKLEDLQRHDNKLRKSRDTRRDLKRVPSNPRSQVQVNENSTTSHYDNSDPSIINFSS